MDYTNNPIFNPAPVPTKNHNKARWIIIFIACLIVVVAVVTIFKKQMINISPVHEMTEEEKIIEATSAKNKVNVSAEEMKEIINSTTAKSGANSTSEAERKKILDATSVK